MKVLVVPNNKLPRITVNLSFDRDPLVEGDKAGMLGLVGQMMRSGTQSRTKAELDEEIDFIGASLGAGSSSIYASSLTRHQDKLMELMTDILYNPKFPQEELEKLKKQAISGLESNKDDPSAIASRVAGVLNYGADHPYGELDSKETYEAITVDDIRQYYSTYMRPSIAYLTIVGDITKKDAKKLAKKYFSKWDGGNVPTHSYEVPQPADATEIALVDRPSSVQSVIRVTHPVNLAPGHPDVIPVRVMNQILGGGFSSRLMQNLREDKAYTYGARSSISNDELVGNFNASASVRNEVTDSAVVEFMNELNGIRNAMVTDAELAAAKASIVGSFARSLESPQTVAAFAQNIIEYNLPEDYYATYLQKVNAVTKADIMRVAKQYVRPDKAYVLVVGKASEVAAKLAAIAPVQYYTMEGEPYTPEAAASIPDGYNASKVFADYIEAIGGKMAVQNISDVSATMEANTQMGPIKMVVVNRKDGSFNNVVSVGGQVMSKQVSDGEKISVMMQGRNVPLTPEQTKDALIDGNAFPELNLAALGAKAELTGIEAVEGSDAYAIDITLPSGAKQTWFYDVETGLKVRRTQYVQTPQGEMAAATDISDYREINGVMIPYMMKIPMGPMKLEAKATEVLINTNPDASMFEVK